MPPRRHLQKGASSSHTSTNEQASGSSVARLQYEPPSHLPLNPAPARLLQTLAASHASEHSAIRKTIQDALKILSDAAGDLAERVPPVEVGRTIKSDESDEDQDGRDADVKKAHRFLQEMDSSARSMVDRAWEVECSGEVLQQEVVTTGTVGNQDPLEDRATDPRLRKGLWGVFTTEMNTLKEARGEMSMKEKYASVNEYVEFRSVIWESQHAGEPMPPTKQWFPEDNRKGRNNGASQSGTAPDPTAQDDSDSDIELQSTKTSDICPLTLRPFTEPYSSNICPHSFEKSAIFELINNSQDYRPINSDNAGMGRNPRNPVNMNQVEKCVPCPAAGCTRSISLRNLKEDRVIVRRMRIEKERRERLEIEQLQRRPAGGSGKGNKRGGEGGGGGGAVGEESFVDADALQEGERRGGVKREKNWAGNEDEAMDVDDEDEEGW